MATVSDPYEPGTILIDVRGGSITSINLEKGVYSIRLVGSGGYGGPKVGSVNGGGGGGSGAKLVVEVSLEAGTYYYYAANSVATNKTASNGAWFSPQNIFSSETVYFHASGGSGSIDRAGAAGGSSFITRNPQGYFKVLDKLNGISGGNGGIGSTGSGGASVDIDNISGKGGDGNYASTSRKAGQAGRIVITYLRSKP